MHMYFTIDTCTVVVCRKRHAIIVVQLGMTPSAKQASVVMILMSCFKNSTISSLSPFSITQV